MQDDKITKTSEISDGTSNTMMVSEMSGRPHAYLAGGLRDPTASIKLTGFVALCHNNKHTVRTYTYDGLTSPGPCAINASNQFGIYSFHPMGVNALFADGSVHFIAQTVDLFTFFNMIARADGDIISGEAVSGESAF